MPLDRYVDWNFVVGGPNGRVFPLGFTGTETRINPLLSVACSQVSCVLPMILSVHLTLFRMSKMVICNWRAHSTFAGAYTVCRKLWSRNIAGKNSPFRKMLSRLSYSKMVENLCHFFFTTSTQIWLPYTGDNEAAMFSIGLCRL